VIRDADTKGLWQIASEIADLAGRAQNRKIKPDEMGGASMSISNLGGIGGIGFTPIVNPPELAILGITRTETVTVWDGDTPRRCLWCRWTSATITASSTGRMPHVSSATSVAYWQTRAG